MKNFIKLVLLINNLFICFVDCQTLKSLVIVHRHGDRLTEYSNDVCPKDKFTLEMQRNHPDDIGQLTERGKQRMFDSGKNFLREKYSELLNKDLRVEIRSSAKDRCIESSRLLINGFLKGQNLNTTWPIHTTPLQYDSMLYPFSDCTKANDELDNIYRENDEKFRKTYKDLIEFLEINCGTKITDINHVFHIYDILINEDMNSDDLKWLSPKILEQILEASLLKFQLMSSSKLIKRLRAGIFLNEMIEKMKFSILNKEENVKFLNVYSTHDVFLSYLFSSLGINNQMPPYGSMLIFELHENDSSLHWDENGFIKILYFNETETRRTYEFKVPLCLDSEQCSIKKFRQQIEDFRLNQTEWQNECEKK